ncbi:MAG: ester cyclase [Hyphomicrobiales bacterium]
MHHTESLYRAYIACLNAQDWARLGEFVAEGAIHNGRAFGLAGYRAMLENDFRQIPDLKFVIDVLVASETHVAARLMFNCSPAGEFLGLPVNGRHVTFSEIVIYAYTGGKITEVWSVIDKAAVERQIAPQ